MPPVRVGIEPHGNESPHKLPIATHAHDNYGFGDSINVLPRNIMSTLETTPADAKDLSLGVALSLASSDFEMARLLAESENHPFYGGKTDLRSLISVLEFQAYRVNGGDLKQPEAMLINQATALQSLFATLSARGLRSQDTNQFEVLLKLGLKAQSQCRATLETLGNLKNPTVFTRQTNIASQQVVANGPPAPARKEKPHNELLENTHGERLDFGAKATTGGIDLQLEAVGAVNRAVNPRGQGGVVGERL